MARRANGEGGIVELKGRNLRRPFWVFITTDKHTSGGHRRKETLDYFATRTEAEAFLARYVRRPIDKYNFTIEQIYDEWLDKRKRKVKSGKLSQAALNCNTAAWDHLKIMAKNKMRYITTDQIQHVIDGMIESGKHSKSACEKVKSLASMLCEYGMENDVIDRNYASFADIDGISEGTRSHWSDIEQLKIEKAAEDGIEWADCIIMMNYSGVRIEEFLTIKKFGAIFEDNDQNKPLIAVIGGIKTEAGRDRLIPIHPKAEKYWRKWYFLDSSSEYIISKSASKKSRNRGKNHFNKDWWRDNCYYAAIDEINAQGGNIRRLSPHSCRHTFATIADASGIPPEKIAQIMGHSDFAHTKRYTHQDAKALRTCITMINP